MEDKLKVIVVQQADSYQQVVEEAPCVKLPRVEEEEPDDEPEAPLASWRTRRSEPQPIGKYAKKNLKER